MKKARAAEAASATPAQQGEDDRDEELKRLRKLTVEQAKTIESKGFGSGGRRFVRYVGTREPGLCAEPVCRLEEHLAKLWPSFSTEP